MFFLFWRQIETEPFNYSRFMSRFNIKMTLKRLCSVQLGESCSGNLGNTSKNSYLMSPVQLNSASSTCPKSVQKEKEFTITAWHSFFKVSSLYTRPFLHIFKMFYRIQGGPYFFRSSIEYSETPLFTQILIWNIILIYGGGCFFFPDVGIFISNSSYLSFKIINLIF